MSLDAPRDKPSRLSGNIEFASLGYAGTSLRNVAERAHVTQALPS